VRIAVLDASVVLKWFHDEQEGSAEAASLQELSRRGELSVIAPAFLLVEALNVAGRSWGWKRADLNRLTMDLQDLLVEFDDPDLENVVTWVARGLTAYDALYVALAEENGVPLITDDSVILALAPDIAEPLRDGGDSRGRR
jgi:predicted nucleic acid-binding protein